MSKTKLLDKRNAMKSKKPDFKRQDVNRYKQFEGSWRRPRGIHSKLRMGFRGHNAVPTIGYGSPSEVKGLSKKGLNFVSVYNVKDLDNVKEGCIMVIGGTVGTKKKLEILAKAKEKKFTVMGIKDIDAFVTKINDKLALKKKEAEKKKDAKKKKEEKAKEKKDDKKVDEKKEVSKEEKKETKKQETPKKKVEDNNETKK